MLVVERSTGLVRVEQGVRRRGAEKERILVVDDDEVLQRVLMVTLGKAGTGRAVASAEEARLSSTVAV